MLFLLQQSLAPQSSFDLRFSVSATNKIQIGFVNLGFVSCVAKKKTLMPGGKETGPGSSTIFGKICCVKSLLCPFVFAFGKIYMTLNSDAGFVPEKCWRSFCEQKYMLYLQTLESMVTSFHWLHKNF